MEEMLHIFAFDMKQIPELQYLLALVEKKFGHPLKTSKDFNVLSVVIEHETGDAISCSTIKRLWGYMTMKPVPRLASLDILAKYAGYKGFEDFRACIKKADNSQSDYAELKSVCPSDLTPGDILNIGWNPNRLVSLRYLGESRYEVAESCNSKLHPGDTFELGPVFFGYPIIIPAVIRDGKPTEAFIAAQENGITSLELIHK